VASIGAGQVLAVDAQKVLDGVFPGFMNATAVDEFSGSIVLAAMGGGKDGGLTAVKEAGADSSIRCDALGSFVPPADAGERSGSIGE